LLLVAAPSPPKKQLRRPKLPLSKQPRLMPLQWTLLRPPWKQLRLMPLLPQPTLLRLRPTLLRLRQTLLPPPRLLRPSKSASKSASLPIGFGKAAPKRRPFFM
jgi:hypothetical protein